MWHTSAHNPTQRDSSSVQQVTSKLHTAAPVPLHAQPNNTLAPADFDAHKRDYGERNDNPAATPLDRAHTGSAKTAHNRGGMDNDAAA